MKKSNTPKSFIRIFVSMIVASGISRGLGLAGINMFLVFFVVYFVVSQIFYRAIDPLMEDAAKLHEEEDAEENILEINPEGYSVEDAKAETTPEDGEKEAWSEFSPYFLLSLTDSIPEMPKSALNAKTSFQPIQQERHRSSYQNSSNQIFVTEADFSHWMGNLQEVYQVEIPQSLVYQWAQGQDLQTIYQWLQQNGNGPETTTH